ncbi:Phage terminase-like protein, large subunit, contains N-terminal HTH domain [Sphingomonas gellani]|uniref:Phage terminase-like protein, large subunit, contains N-terminal HTH domain n=1 Tax=Sphingomonas gellani TaxID=1166340 RepID=A0A1H7Y412_9SPHN|nr:terminase TerL endonuclease subunit [Sphingomonas gellani]SEM40860.1 Phage terminase-like protein, large subunit, contains N-terminal HTH domain [Sphingomonas gellani]
MRQGKGHFATVAVHYAQQVVAGLIPACWQIRTSCQRFLDDVNGDTWTLNAAKVERVCQFAETFPYLEGPLAAKKLKLKLEPWQVWILTALFGLVDAQGHRKHREAFIFIPRKNGKSTFAAVIALYMLVADYEQRAQVYIGATALKQADYCFQPCRDMAQKAPAFVTHWGARVTKKKIETHDGSFLEPMIGNPPDGSNPHLAILDEAHENDNFARQRETMRTGMGARTQPLLITITTAGFNEAGDCRLLQAQCEQVLSGELTDIRRFSAIYTIDKDDDWRDFEVWKKANPNVGVSFTEARLRELHQTALDVPSEKPGLLTKHLNVWQSSSTAWVNMKDWDANGDAIPFADAVGQNYRAWIGADLSRLLDTTAIVLLVEVPSATGGEPTYHLYPTIMLPEMAVQRSPKNAVAYREWSAGERPDLILTPNDETDFAAVEAKILELCGQFRVEGVAVDQWQAANLSQRLREQHDVPVLTYPQNFQNMSPPMGRFEKLIALGQLKHTGNRMMRWMVGNVVAKHHGEFIKPIKPVRQDHLKIDGFVSLLMALGLASVAAPAPQEVWIDILD